MVVRGVGSRLIILSVGGKGRMALPPVMVEVETFWNILLLLVLQYHKNQPKLLKTSEYDVTLQQLITRIVTIMESFATGFYSLDAKQC